MADSIVILALGSNLGDRFEHLQSALNALESVITIKKISSVYETPPFEMIAEQDFLNLCLLGKTNLEPLELLEYCQELESKRGRSRSNLNKGYESRPLDIDILFYDDQVILEELLKIPHPEINNRNFVLKPLNEIAPNYIHPVSKKSICSMWKEFKGERNIERITGRIHSK